jgi:hypothetical protein
MLRHLLAIFSGCEPDGPAELMQSNFLHGYARLPVRLTAGS